MRAKALNELILPSEILSIHGDIDFSKKLSLLCSDSRLVKENTLFFAIPGEHVDGHLFLNQVGEKGAYCAVVERYILDAPIKQIVVENSRRFLSLVAKRFYDHPSDNLTMIGVTGTDGKSSTVYFTFQLLRMLGVKAGFFSTVAYQIGDELEANSYRQSTLEALELEELLARMVEAGSTTAIIESTSHGLSHKTNRLRDIEFDFSAFTNLSHEHLEFHGTIEQYAQDKSNLFAQTSSKKNPLACSIINFGDKRAHIMSERSSAPVIAYYSTNRGDIIPKNINYWASNIMVNAQGISFDFNEVDKIHRAQIKLIGLFNIENILAASILSAKITQKSLEEIVALLPKIQSVKGRMLLVDEGQNFTVIVDYAHTPGAYEQVLPSLRQACKNRLILVFGSAGERDVQKRPIQGALAAQYGDILIITSEDPRLENPDEIIAQIETGARNHKSNIEILTIADRHLAVEKAISIAQEGDLIALLGKGHEQSIIYPEGKRPYDEEKTARIALKRLLGKEI